MSGLDYVSSIVSSINEKVCGHDDVLMFGENIDFGSKLSGLALGLTCGPNGLIQNVANSELTHCGVGLGMMLDGGKSILFVKQLDFMLLGMDQICNTNYSIKAFSDINTLGSFTILTIVCDQGYQGPQSSFNDVSGISSIANVPAFCLNTSADIKYVINEHVVSNGFKFICVSQQLLNSQPLDDPILWGAEDVSILKYRDGESATILSFNFCLEKSLNLESFLKDKGLGADVFHINFCPSMDLNVIVESCRKTNRLIVIDDSKGIHNYSDKVSKDILASDAEVSLLEFCRSTPSNASYEVCDDMLVINEDAAYKWLTSI